MGRRVERRREQMATSARERLRDREAHCRSGESTAETAPVGRRRPGWEQEQEAVVDGNDDDDDDGGDVAGCARAQRRRLS